MRGAFASSRAIAPRNSHHGVKVYTPLCVCLSEASRTAHEAPLKSTASMSRPDVTKEPRMRVPTGLGVLLIASTMAMPSWPADATLVGAGPISAPRTLTPAAATQSPAQSARRAFPGRNGRIAFQAYVNKVSEVFTIRPDGEDRKRLTHNDVYDSDPTWSPRGQRIAVTVYDLDKPDASNDIYVLSADGLHRTRVTVGARGDVGPTWSPSGKQIAFAGTVSHQFQGFELFTIKVDGSGLTRLTNNATMDFSPMWSPKGRRIAYEGWDGTDVEIYTIRQDGTHRRQVTHNAVDDYAPSWSPFGRRIAYSGTVGKGQEVFTIRPDGTGLRQITHSGNSGDPCWSPNGRRLAYAALALVGSDAEIYTIRRNGTVRRRLTHNSGDDVKPDWRPVRLTA
jgi:Tol biopolymer transport system component